MRKLVEAALKHTFRLPWYTIDQLMLNAKTDSKLAQGTNSLQTVSLPANIKQV